ncbi:MAG: PAS domain-containing sensor histidine kinase [Gammaproteobacteria bacterium]
MVTARWQHRRSRSGGLSLSRPGQLATQVMARDITERKEAEVRFRTLVEEIPAITYISRYEPNCRAVYQSPQVESLLGFSVEEWYERPDLWVQRLHPDDRTRVLTVFQRTYAELVPFSEDYRLLTKNEAVLWVHDESRVVLDPCGAPKWIQGVMLDITERKRIEQTLRESEKRYQDLARKLVTAQEEERRRIAGELHDQMGQYLTALQLGLGSLEHSLSDNPAARDCLDRVKGIAEEIDQQVDRLALELRPAALDDLDLREVLVNYIEEWSQRSGIQVDLQCRGFKQRYLPSNVEIVMYRAVQETLTNVLKHARAEHVGVILECRDNEIYTIIEDDGCGFDPGATHCRPAGDRSLGLLSMKERIELLGGTCQLESTPGIGTTMFCRVPLPEAFPSSREHE